MRQQQRLGTESSDDGHIHIVSSGNNNSILSKAIFSPINYQPMDVRSTPGSDHGLDLLFSQRSHENPVETFTASVNEAT